MFDDGDRLALKYLVCQRTVKSQMRAIGHTGSGVELDCNKIRLFATSRPPETEIKPSDIWYASALSHLSGDSFFCGQVAAHIDAIFIHRLHRWAIAFPE